MATIADPQVTFWNGVCRVTANGNLSLNLITETCS